MKRAAIEAVGSAQDISAGVLQNPSVQGKSKSTTMIAGSGRIGSGHF